MKILIVDDSATSRAIFKAQIPASIECEIFEADHRDTALEQVANAQPDICVMDYNLPDYTGTEIAQAILETGLKPQFILMTANMQDQVVERAKELNFVAFIEKPITADKIETAFGVLS